MAPRPSALGGRDSSDTKCGCISFSSAASSMVISRSPTGIRFDSTFSSVVLPEPVPPETMMLLCCSTQMRRNSIIAGEALWLATSVSGVITVRLKRRMVMVGPFSATGGMMALTREPSGRRASTSGEDSSMRRPSGATMRSITLRMASSSENASGTCCSLPLRSTKMSVALLTMISLISGSVISLSRGPRPTASSTLSCTSMLRSMSGGRFCMPATIRSTAERTSAFTSSAENWVRLLRRRSITSSSCRCTRRRQPSALPCSCAALA